MGFNSREFPTFPIQWYICRLRPGAIQLKHDINVLTRSGRVGIVNKVSSLKTYYQIQSAIENVTNDTIIVTATVQNNSPEPVRPCTNSISSVYCARMKGGWKDCSDSQQTFKYKVLSQRMLSIIYRHWVCLYFPKGTWEGNEYELIHKYLLPSTLKFSHSTYYFVKNRKCIALYL